MIRVTVWNEYFHETCDEKVMEIYPDGIHRVIGKHLENAGFDIKYATLHEENHGLSDETLENTDVLIWWAHCAHREVSDEIAKKVHKRVLAGMGIIFLHSAHLSKPFLNLMGTSGTLIWRESGDREIMWPTNPLHPLFSGVKTPVILDHEEMYGESFDIPTPDELVAISSFSGGEVFRSLCVWQRGRGKVIYFQPGHETYPTYHNESILKIIENCALYVVPKGEITPLACKNTQPLV